MTSPSTDWRLVRCARNVAYKISGFRETNKAANSDEIQLTKINGELFRLKMLSRFLGGVIEQTKFRILGTYGALTA